MTNTIHERAMKLILSDNPQEVLDAMMEADLPGSFIDALRTQDPVKVAQFLWLLTVIQAAYNGAKQ